MQQYACEATASAAVIDARNLIDCRSQTFLFSLRIAKAEVFRRRGDDHDACGWEEALVLLGILGDVATLSSRPGT